nr:ATP-dependent RecD-like DNA helicase [uncultured Noviherbaspirillum sp.]
MDQATGILSSLSVYNDKWGRGSLRLDDGKRLACVGEALAGLSAGNRYRVEGRIVDHPSYGLQIMVSAAAVDLPCSADALAAHLKANFRGCGEATARKLVDHYSDRLHQLRDLLIENPHAVDFSAVTRRRIAAADGLDTASLICRDLSGRVGATGVKHAVLRRLAAWLLPSAAASPDPVRKAWAVLADNPYAPIQHVDGYSFPVADRIARSCLGFPRFHRTRLAALATHALRDGCERNGHSFLGAEELAERIAACDSEAPPEAALAAALELGEPVVVQHGCHYPRHLFHCEQALALHLARRALQIAAPMSALEPAGLEAEINAAECSMGDDFRLDPDQRTALLRMLASTHLLHTLTAGPGCGKTAMMEMLAHVARDRAILFCAPTGKAAKVLASRVQRYGRTAVTIHSLLGVKDDGYRHDAENLLEADVVVVDESSMLDLALARALLDALPPACHLILLGDGGQLSSVGPGDVLASVLKLPGDHHQLHQGHRNDGGIRDLVQQCRRGEVDCHDRPGVRFLRSLPPPDDVGLSRVIQAYLAAVRRCGLERVALLMPRRKGDIHAPGWNTTFMNEALRRELNPDGRRVPGTTLRIGDRLIIRRNLALDAEGNEQVVNGDTGTLLGAALDAAGTSVLHLELALDDGRTVRFPSGAIESLALAYAMTVHAAQGSEYREVIVICTGGSPAFVHRGMLTTAFSRARDSLTVLGDPAAIRAICLRPAPRRNALLVERTVSAMRRMHRAGVR